MIDDVLLALGVIGYVTSFVQVANIRWWLGQRGQGWPRILVNTLVALLALLALLFGISLAGHLGWLRYVPRAWRYVISYVTVGALVLAPWLLAVTLWAWRRQAERNK